MTKAQIDAVIEIARHIRDEAAQSLDAQCDAELASRFARRAHEQLAGIAVATAGGACCTPTKSGQSCC